MHAYLYKHVYLNARAYKQTHTHTHTHMCGRECWGDGAPPHTPRTPHKVGGVEGGDGEDL